MSYYIVIGDGQATCEDVALADLDMIRRDGRRGRRDGLLERAYVLACRDGRVDEAATTLRDLIVAAEVTP